jgi:hypothetical protein
MIPYYLLLKMVRGISGLSSVVSGEATFAAIFSTTSFHFSLVFNKVMYQ